MVNISNDPRVTLTYDPTTNSVTMDLSALPQSLLPSDTYGLVVVSAVYNAAGQLVMPGVTDVVGNALDGNFNGVTFPSGDGIAGGNFVQVLPVTLTGPIFNFVQLAPASDSGIKGDSNTNVTQPSFVGQVGANFPGSAAGVIVYAEFAGLHGGKTTLGVGPGGRGLVGTYDTYAITNASGQFTITAPAGLPDGLNNVVLVAVGQADQPLLPSLSTATATSVRIDTSLPTLDTSGTHTDGSSIPMNSDLNALTALTLYITDPVNPQTLGSPFAVPTLLSVPALDPSDGQQHQQLHAAAGRPARQGQHCRRELRRPVGVDRHGDVHLDDEACLHVRPLYRHDQCDLLVGPAERSVLLRRQGHNH